MKKEHAVSVAALHQNSQQAFQPEEGHSMACLIGGTDRVSDVYLIEPSVRHPGFFFLSHIDCGEKRVDYSTRPLRGDQIETWLKAEGLVAPGEAEWKAHPCAGVEKAGQSLTTAMGAA